MLCRHQEDKRKKEERGPPGGFKEPETPIGKELLLLTGPEEKKGEGGSKHSWSIPLAEERAREFCDDALKENGEKKNLARDVSIEGRGGKGGQRPLCCDLGSEKNRREEAARAPQKTLTPHFRKKKRGSRQSCTYSEQPRRLAGTAALPQRARISLKGGREKEKKGTSP